MAKQIMIIDDSASLRQLVHITLRSAGYEVLEAADGIEAIAKLAGKKVHLVICDVNMPNMDGIGFLNEVKHSAQLRFTPIIMLTTESDEAHKRAAQEAGARAWMVKPFQPAQLLSAVAKLCLP
ncbi:response regulator [Viridibacterium curvum]|uniref:Response regulator n=1 Tax=Viridibacterium curvum TaxID=1101404 RepID=A0ABP9QM12_9RHOO